MISRKFRSWICMGLEIASNNEAKVLSASKGLQFFKEHGAKKAVVVGDSSIIIWLLKHQVPSQNPCLSRLIHHIKAKAKDFEEVEFFPVFCSFNMQIVIYHIITLTVYIHIRMAGVGSDHI
jgi:ribonuclease HI